MRGVAQAGNVNRPDPPSRHTLPAETLSGHHVAFLDASSIGCRKQCASLAASRSASLRPQEDGHRCGDELKSHIVEYGGEGDALRHRVDVDVLEARSHHEAAQIARLQKNVLGAFDLRCVRSEVAIHALTKAWQPAALDGAVDARLPDPLAPAPGAFRAGPMACRERTAGRADKARHRKTHPERKAERAPFEPLDGDARGGCSPGHTQHARIEVQSNDAPGSHPLCNKTGDGTCAASDIECSVSCSWPGSVDEICCPYRRYGRHEVALVELGGATIELPMVVCQPHPPNTSAPSECARPAGRWPRCAVYPPPPRTPHPADSCAARHPRRR